MPDQLIMYDSALANKVIFEFSGLVENKNLTVLLGTPDRAFAEFKTVTPTIPDGVPPIPRCAITIGDPIVDNTRFNSSTIRKLGYVDTKTKLEIYRGKFPVPVNIPYTINFWTEKFSGQMNLYVQKIMQLWRTQYMVLVVDVDTIDPNDIYGKKQIYLYAEGGIIDNGDLEPGRKARLIRKTFEFIAKAWLWDLPVPMGKVTSVKDICTEFRDKVSQSLFDTVCAPISRILFTGDGTTTIFSGNVDASFLPIGENTLFLDATVGGSTVRVFDNGVGLLTGTGISAGTVDYATGAVTVTYTTAPDDLTDIVVGYFEN